ncbi:DUF3443 family protein [Caenimonas terrae]|uniref:DUF3443 family protein n=1 Tax=Caenimonas terrae TaxID=696074 RepID=A0ABW0NK07_9BURK
MRALRRIACALLASFVLHGCGGGGGDSSTPAVTAAANAQPVAVTAGSGGNFPNTLSTSVTICVPGTGNCQTIPNVQVDTGSSGLRLLASAITLALPPVTSPADGSRYSECAGFADGVVWGALARADVKLASETASSLSIQVIQDNAAGPAPPAACTAQGMAENTMALLGGNGILGVGNFLQDCGAFCAGNASAVYFTCPAGGACTGAAIATAAQVANPAAFFTQDNNGLIVQLPAVGTSGSAPVTGSMLFGIGTQPNNGLAAAPIPVGTSGSNAGSFTALYRGTVLPNSFFDSGSSALFFDDASLPTCARSGATGDVARLYCPGTSAALSATPVTPTIVMGNATSAAVPLTVANALFLLAQSPAPVAFNDLGGPAGAALPGAFDFGLPFFFGRSVYVAFEQRSAGGTAGPYVAYQPLP